MRTSTSSRPAEENFVSETLNYKYTPMITACDNIALMYLRKKGYMKTQNFTWCNKSVIRLSEVQRKTGAELVYKSIARPNLGHHLLFRSQNPPHNAIRDEFGTSLSMNFGKANLLGYLLVNLLGYFAFLKSCC